jgi:Histidine kinase-, DNA gyrase B-, and HSP90-like ATPase
VGETRVDLVHLLEDLRDAYPGALEETILTEIVANALDSGASRIRFVTDPVGASFTAVDDGSGMRRRELARYHDVAASTKARGDGIGFAGVGIKLGLLVCEEVVTESRRGKTHVASSWHLASRHRAPWRWVPPPGFVTERGTAVRLRLRNALSPLLDRGFVEASIRRHFRSLLDPAFDAVLRAHYPRGVRIEVNGRELEPVLEDGPERAPLLLRVGRQRKPSAVGWLVRESAPLPEERRGVAVSTFGKVIKQGWEWLGVTPSVPEQIGGLVEVPALAASLTLNKADFIRTGPRGAVYLTYGRPSRKPRRTSSRPGATRATRPKSRGGAPRARSSATSSAYCSSSPTTSRCSQRWSSGVATASGRSRSAAHRTRSRRCMRRPRRWQRTPNPRRLLRSTR